MNALALSNLTFSYPNNDRQVLSISGFVIRAGQKVFLHGPSGSGKTTLLSIVGGLFLPTTGTVEILGRNITAFSQSQRDAFRAKELGFIFQVFNLLPYLSVLENVILPCKFGRATSNGFKDSSSEGEFLLQQLGIAEFKDRPVNSLSIGQQQRVAAARALIGSPSVIIADEPTSALDADSREEFLSILFEQATRERSTVLFVSHDRSIAKQFDDTYSLIELNNPKAANSGDKNVKGN